MEFFCLCVKDGYRDRDRRSPTYYDESEPEESFRIFVALFDYDPLSMSPNPDAADEELPFKEGQIIRVGDYRYFDELTASVSSAFIFS